MKRELPKNDAVPEVEEPLENEGQGAEHYNLLDRYAQATLAQMTAGISPYSYNQAFMDWLVHLSRAPGRQADLVNHAQENALGLVRHGFNAMTGGDEPPPFKTGVNDHRFVDEGWQRAPFTFWQQAFLATQDWFDYAARDFRGLRTQDADRVQFMYRQWLDLISPSNFPWMNPEIIQTTMEQGGRNLVEGAAHFYDDFMHVITEERRPPPEGYRLGEDLACTPGSVVFRNDLFELIQYPPQTESVHKEPILFVPAWIMKYYVLDLSPKNSMIRYLVENGFTVFVISWCNPTKAQADLSLEDYRKRGVMAALDVISAIAPGEKIHTNGYCLGGTILAITAATMARDGDDRLASVTLMATQVDFSEAGELLLFLDESQVALLEDMMWEQGYLDRPQMSRIFAVMRSEDLIYTRAVRRYFLGKDDLPTDLGVWASDTTRMPARMHGEYLRGLFLENRLTAGRFAVEGQVIALKDIRAPMFIVGTESDHIAPWQSVYKTSLFTDNDMTLVVTNGGHNTGILSEPGHPSRHYRIARRKPGAAYIAPDDWFAEQEPKEGSWWSAWLKWLRARNGDEAAPPSLGAAEQGYPIIEPAPGSYIHQG
ncbi:PHA/PHB synthase family protein [Celeribacter litoreus]|uniref:PHA/PHB synthase family protein n=1 Tax=Celeribacter litoreus TaxID=2876714 RepID=UPI001CCBE5C9|nr:alpha/beta fold hydrolase [Celeribacter litoreus]MCA0045105.1 alpha/beta fold hydrolase [Celeribacter litoreus]